jgi:transglutaminase-like putative cysteine protease
MRNSFLILFLLFGNLTLSAQDLSVFNIPKELLKGANLVNRNEVIDITIKTIGSAVVRHTYAYTILNDKADNYAEFSTYYDKFRTIEDIEGRLLDATGKEIKKVKKKDISDQSSESGMSISEGRYKSHNFYSKDYPYTVEYTEVNQLNGIFFLPGWIPQFSPSMGVQQSKLVVKTPPGYQLRYKEYNFQGKLDITDFEGGKKYEWTVVNLKTIKQEPLMPSWSRERTYVALAPTEFEIDGYKGNMRNWQEFGKFRQQLIKDRDELPEPIVAKAKQLIAGVNDPYEKIAILYKFLQDNTRYISIQLGIGGWQPIPAAKVAQSGYGDCKGLSNYMSALLKVAGLPSRYVVINSGDDGFYIDPDFVSNQFDHAILCVPLVKDTVWLECTSNILPAGYLGDFTYNRPALIIDETGGTMVRTPTYKKNENLQIRNIEAIVDEGGNLNARSKTIYSGLQQDDLYGMLKTSDKDDMMRMLRNRFDLPTYDIVSYNYEAKPQKIPELTETIDMSVTGFAQVSGKRLFLVPNVFSKSGIKLIVDSVRRFDIVLEYDYLVADSVHIKVPAGYEVESLPKPQSILSKFGEYTSSFFFENDMILYTRNMSQNQGRYPAKEFGDIAAFYQSIHKADRVKVVLKKKEQP